MKAEKPVDNIQGTIPFTNLIFTFQRYFYISTLFLHFTIDYFYESKLFIAN